MRLGVKNLLLIFSIFLLVNTAFADEKAPKTAPKKKEVAKIVGLNKSCVVDKCQKRLECIRIDVKDKRRCSVAKTKCSKDSECCSEKCIVPEGEKAGICKREYRCVKPIADKKPCFHGKSVCAYPGICQDFNQNTANIGECFSPDQKCKENVECCSNKCSRGKCVVNNVCKICASQGEKPGNGRRCCEGHYEYKGTCLIDVPPPM